MPELFCLASTFTKLDSRLRGNDISDYLLYRTIVALGTSKYAEKNFTEILTVLWKLIPDKPKIDY